MRSVPGSDPREARLHRFGVGLGLALAAGIHALVLWGPDVAYRPVLEQARVRRALRVRPYVPPPPPPPRPEPPPRAGTGAAEAPPAPVNRAEARRKAPAAERAREAPSERPPAGAVPRPGLPEPEVRKPGAPVAESRAEPKPPAPPPADVRPEPRPDEWSAVVAELEARGEALAERQAARGRGVEGAGEGEGAGGAGGGGEEGYLDPRIRVTVVSYPPTGIEEIHPPIPYPDLRFHRRELQKGICRVWYRVWTDAAGRIVRTQLKAPATADERELYAPFVRAVTESVAGWPFDRREAEIHVDVLFEIE
ncbi:hypothetical protein [Deferrisoma sp.]